MVHLGPRLNRSRGSFGIPPVMGRDSTIREGLFTRAERVILIGGGSIIGQVRIALWILAILANATALQRLYLIWRKTREEAKGEPSDTA